MTTTTQLAELQEEIRARYSSLSKRLKQIAQYVLDNSSTIPFDTIAEIAKKADVPPSTLIRFANAFGYDGFNEMKQVFRDNLMEDTVSYTERVKLYRQTNDDGMDAPESPSEILKTFSMVNATALKQLPNSINKEDLALAVELLNNAENIYVIGLRRSFSVASYLTYAFRHLERRTFLIDGLGGMFREQLALVKPTDVVIAISYSPYSKEVVDLVQLGVEKGAKQIAITDSMVSPLSAFSDVSFVIREAQMDGFRSQISSMCLAQTLMLSMAVDNAK
ncbi:MULTISPECIES: MurR/RpiR family transcriptional regulator [Vibrio]|uniref:SIS domain-containing protein n=2 Tax=Vibrio TaxID=662 RepID=A0A7X4LK11_9VIBR|nr:MULTISPECIES: MurR/RpiR family transcriptional regulator [Vibrio]MBF9002377.1 MurR/RpiR family transcriptional regulator [Vibrio nitrifigilis]MZI93042.1 SIS domain-containing protein [Vibrio eleionomae]